MNKFREMSRMTCIWSTFEVLIPPSPLNATFTVTKNPIRKYFHRVDRHIVLKYSTLDMLGSTGKIRRAYKFCR